MQRDYTTYDYWLRNAQAGHEWRWMRADQYDPEGYCNLANTDYRITERTGSEPNPQDPIRYEYRCREEAK